MSGDIDQTRFYQHSLLMRMLVLLTCTLLVPATLRAECFDRASGKRPSLIEYDNGDRLEILSAEPGYHRYVAFLKDGKFLAEFTSEAGLRLVKSVSATGTIARVNWTTPLPDPLSLATGTTFESRGLRIQQGFEIVSVEYEVIGTDEFKLGDCSYEVLRLKYRMDQFDGAYTEGIRTYDPWTMLAYEFEFVLYKPDGTTQDFGGVAVRIE